MWRDVATDEPARGHAIERDFRIGGMRWCGRIVAYNPTLESVRSHRTPFLSTLSTSLRLHRGLLLQYTSFVGYSANLAAPSQSCRPASRCAHGQRTSRP